MSEYKLHLISPASTSISEAVVMKTKNTLTKYIEN